MDPAPTPTRRFSVDPIEYPFADHWFSYRGAPVHYVDEGEGPVVVLLHGNPTWSYLYRNVIKALRRACRLVAPDYPGFGFSSAPAGYGYTPAEHSAVLEALIAHLGLRDVTLVVQDWGGPIGLRYAVDHPGNIRALVIMNTWVFAPDRAAKTFSFLMGGPGLGKLLQTRANFFARVIVPRSIYHKAKITRTLRRAYTDPFPTPESRLPTWVFPREIVRSSDWIVDIESRLGALRGKPVQLLWAMKDMAFGHERIIAAWQRHFPAAELERLGDASHYLQEDRPDRVAAMIRRALTRAGG